jgi:transcriptional regulator with XRE-family HTH domain
MNEMDNDHKRQYHKEIGRRIGLRRNEMGLTQEQLAARLGIAQNTLQYYEHGTFNRMNTKLFQKMCESMNITMEWLLGATHMSTSKFRNEVTLWMATEDGFRLVNELFEKYRDEKQNPDCKVRKQCASYDCAYCRDYNRFTKREALEKAASDV